MMPPVPVAVLNEWGPIPSYHIRLGDPLAAGNIHARTFLGDEPDAAEAIAAAGLVIVQRGYGERILALARQAKAASRPLLYEIDDYLLELPKQSNFVFKPEEKRNMEEMIGLADLVTVSTGSLADALQPLNPNIQVLENYALSLPRVPQERAPHLVLVNTDYFKLDDSKSAFFSALEHAVVNFGYRISFFGSIDPMMASLQASHPDRIFITDTFEPDRSAFLRSLGNSGVNVACVPLSTYPAHIYKSDIKYLDFASLGIPGIYNNRDVYQYVQHGVDGLICEDTLDGWLTALYFFADPLRRRLCGARARLRATHERSLARYAADLIGVLARLQPSL